MLRRERGKRHGRSGKRIHTAAPELCLLFSSFFFLFSFPSLLFQQAIIHHNANSSASNRSASADLRRYVKSILHRRWTAGASRWKKKEREVVVKRRRWRFVTRLLWNLVVDLGRESKSRVREEGRGEGERGRRKIRENRVSDGEHARRNLNRGD